jgi:hypothetical protein
MPDTAPEAVPYVPPMDCESNAENSAAYLTAHKAGWDHASVNSADESTADDAERWAREHYGPAVDRLWLRAYEGFCDGMNAFAAAARTA